MKELFQKKKNLAKQDKTTSFNPDGKIPGHVAIVMDGNGRWAKNRFLPRIAGHKEGMNTVRKITKHANKMGIKVLTLYAFSTENWSRPEEEVNFLMQLPIDFFDTFVPDLVKENVQVQVTGFTEKLPPKTKKAVQEAIERTQENTGLILNFALNYGARADMIEASKKIAQKVLAGELELDHVDEAVFEQSLMTAKLGKYQDIDLMIRTSGEQRISNFLLWENAYSEFYFPTVLWPDFNEGALENAIGEYQRRHRRFGGL